MVLDSNQSQRKAVSNSDGRPVFHKQANKPIDSEAPALSLHEDREAYFQKLAKESHYAPERKKTVSVRTLRHWNQTYRKQGIEGLKKKRRSDVTINKLLQAEFFGGLPASTMYCHLRIREATKTQLGVVREKVGCRWTRETPNSLWMGDFSHGPLALVDGKARQTFLSVWIDHRLSVRIGS